MVEPILDAALNMSVFLLFCILLAKSCALFALGSSFKNILGLLLSYCMVGRACIAVSLCKRCCWGWLEMSWAAASIQWVLPELCIGKLLLFLHCGVVGVALCGDSSKSGVGTCGFEGSAASRTVCLTSCINTGMQSIFTF